MNEFELRILDFIDAHFSSGFADKAMPVITSFGNAGIVWIVITLAMLFTPKQRKCGIMMAMALIVEAVICNLILKLMVARTRPFDVNPLAELLIAKPKDFSFPSGHTGASFAVVTVLFKESSRVKIPALILALLIGFSRLYLYVHYPTDVLAGALLGILSGLVSVFLYYWYTEKSAKE